MKFVKLSILLLMYSSLSFAQADLSSSNIVLLLECGVTTEESVGDGPYKYWGTRKFNLTVYSKNGKYYIKEQSGTYVPTWWGEGLRRNDLSRTLTNNVFLSGEIIVANSTAQLATGVKSESSMEINRLNGSIRMKFKVDEDKYEKMKSYISIGECQKVQNKF